MEMTVNGRDHEQCYNQQHLGLGLGLSLGIADTTATAEAAPQRAPTAAPPPLPTTARCWNGAGLFFPASSGEQRAHADGQRAAACHEMPFLRGIDVNRAPAGGEMRRSRCASEDEEPGASSPNSTVSSLSGKRSAPARSGGEGEQERADAASDDEDSGAGGGSRKKLRLSKDQSAVLEDSFKEHSTLNPKQKAALARQLGLRPRQVEVWFQNRRARTKLKQTEVDCEALRRRCETLTEENRRLQREAHELRALKLLAPPAPHLYMRVPPPTTLTMCPSCERVASSSSGKPAAAAAPSGPWGPVPVRPVVMDRIRLTN